MARPRKTKPDEILNRAVDLFWRRGYEDTSYEDLVSATGASRYALYSDFGEKQALFHAALDHYNEEVMKHRTADLEQGPEPAQALYDYLRSLAGDLVSDTSRRGCLVCNTAVDERTIDEGIARHAKDILDQVRRRIRRALERSVHQGLLSPAVLSDDLDQVILGYVISMCVLGRTSLSGELVPAMLRSIEVTIERYKE